MADFIAEFFEKLLVIFLEFFGHRIRPFLGRNYSEDLSAKSLSMGRKELVCKDVTLMGGLPI